MSASLRKFILLLLIACLPLQGLSMGVKALSQHTGHAMSMGGEMAKHEMPRFEVTGAEMSGFEMAGHDCCPHDDASPAQPSNSCGDSSHCSLCNVSVTPGVVLPFFATGDATLYPSPSPSVSRFYPELPQRPPLARNA